MNFNAPGVVLAGHVTFENRRYRKFAKNLALNTGLSSKRTTLLLQAIAHAINTPSETCMQWHFAGKSFRQLKISNLNMSKIYSLSLKKGVVLILADYFTQRFNNIVIKIITYGRNSLHDRITLSV